MSISKASFLGLITVFGAGLALGSQAIPNWAAPASWSPSRAHGVTPLSDITAPLPFIGVTPCRVADTRGNGFAGQYGPPALVANATRSFTITGVCGIPASAAAVSFNFGALNVGGNGDLRVFPAGGAVPLVSTLNYNANTPNIANAAVVSLSFGGAITVQADSVPIDLIVDVNGYYASTPGNSSTYFEILGSGLTAIAGLTQSTAGGARGVLGIDGVGVAGFNEGGFGSSGVEGQGQNGIIGRTSTFGGNGASGVAQTDSGLTTYGALGTTTHGVWAFVGDIGCSSCVKAFVDPHPTDPAKEIHFVSLEGNEAGTYFRGTAETVGREFVIQVPEEFRMVTDPEGLTVQLTPVGAPASMYVVTEDLNQIVVRSSTDVRFHYLVQGIRPAYKDFEPVQEMSAYLPQTADGKMMQGWSEWTRRRLIANGTYNPDGTVNTETAERVGWTKMWADREALAKAAAAANAAARAPMLGERK